MDEKAAVKAAAKATGATGTKGAKIKQKVEKKEHLKVIFQAMQRAQIDVS